MVKLLSNVISKYFLETALRKEQRPAPSEQWTVQSLLSPTSEQKKRNASVKC